MMYKPIPAVILLLSLAFIRLSHTTNVFSATTDIAQIFTIPSHLSLPTSPAQQAVRHVSKLCKKEQKSELETLRLLEPCWKGEICYLNTQNNKCIKATGVDKLKDQLDHVGDLVITQTAIYKIPLTESLPSDYGFLYHAFVVFYTPDSPAAPWWSIEKTIRSLVIQRSLNKAEVLDFRDGEKRWDSLRGLPRVVVEDRSRMLLSELLQFLHDSGEINHDYHGINANCQDFAKMIFNRLATGISAWYSMSEGKRPLRIDPEKTPRKQSPSSRSPGRRLFSIPGLSSGQLGLKTLFCLGFVGGVFLELFKLHVAVRGQTFFDFVERKDANDKWNLLTNEEKRDLLIKHGKEHLIEGLNL